MGNTELKLNNGTTIIPDDMITELSQYRWYNNGHDYIERQGRGTDGKRPHIWLHRTVWEYYNGPIPENMQIDHINNNRTDNRIENLRLCTPKQNSRNVSKQNRQTSSIYKGVSFDGLNRKKQWKASIRFDNKLTVIGRFFTEIEAARAYDKKARELFKEFAKLNFEESG